MAVMVGMAKMTKMMVNDGKGEDNGEEGDGVYDDDGDDNDRQ